jgi:hypothetical protein
MSGRPNVFLGTPTGHSLFVNTQLSIDAILPFIGFKYFLAGYSDVALARNLIVTRFLSSDFDWLMWVDSDIRFTLDDWHLLWEGDEALVTAPYARKIPGCSPSLYGLGFTRVHRSVYERIADLRKEDGSEYCGRFYLDGEMHLHCHPVGTTQDDRWLGEDRGFFMLAQLADVNHRLETRTQLRHAGYFEYGYPEQCDPAIHWWSPPPEENA